MEDLRIGARRVIPAAELRFKTSRSGGPGGQHVNTTDTRVELIWDLGRTTTLGAGEKQRCMRALRTYLDRAGRVHLVSQRHRSQRRNREEACARLVRLVRAALVPPKRRIPTRPTKAARARRLEQKRRRSRIKRWRAAPGQDR